MAVIDPKKLLPESSKKTSILVPKSNVQIASPSMSTKMLQPADKPAAGGGSIVVVEKLIKINDILKDTLKVKKDREKAEDRAEEKEERQQREQNLEKQKASKKKGKSLFQIPKSGGLDWLGNWLTWTVLGFLFNNFKEFLAYLKPIWTNVIVPVGKIIYDIGKALLNGFVTFIDIGYSAYKTIEGLIGDLGGEGAEEEFREASKGLTTVMNAALIALMLAASTKPGGGGVDPKKGNRPGRPGTPGNRGRNTGVTRGRGGRPGTGGIFRRGPKVTQGGTGPRLLNRVTRRGASKVTTGLGGSLTGKLGLRAAGRVLKPVLGRLPIVGGLIEFFISWALGDPIGKAAFRGVGSVLVGALGGLIGSIFPGPGTLIGAALGGMAGGELAGRLYDMIFGNEQPKKPKKPKNEKKPDKKPVSKSQQRRKNRRGIQKVERKVAVGRVDKTETRPGQDLLNKARIEKFYGKTHTSGDNTPYDFLVTASGIAKNNTALNGVIGSLMGSGIDLTLGQKPDQRSINQISDTLSAFAAASMQKDLNKAVLEIQEMFALEDGGSVPASRAISRRGGDALVQMKEKLQKGISEAINITSLEIIAKLSNTIKYGGLSSGGGNKPKTETPNTSTYNTTTGGLTTSGGGSDFWTLVAVASLEDGDGQARADVAQSIYNRKASGAYSGSTIRDLILAKTQYQPTWDYPNGTKNGYGNPNDEWFNIVDAQTAAAATGKDVAFIEKAAADIQNKKYQQEAVKFVGGRTDFTNYPKSDRKGQVVRSTNKPNNYFGWDWNYTGTNVAGIPQFNTTIERLQSSNAPGGGEVKGNPVVTSEYGKLRGSRRHGGTDIAAPTGTPLTAVRNGVYEDEFFESAWGTTSVYKTDNGEYHLYAHQSKRAGKKKGDKIQAGEIIGYVGSTGRSTAPHLHWEIGTGWNGYVLSGKSDPLKKYNYKLPFTVGRKNAPAQQTNKKVSPLVSTLPVATGLGRQGTTQTADYGLGGGAGQKGYIIVPGHAAGGGAPGEMELTPELAKNIVANVKKRVGPNVPIKVLDMHGATANTDSAFTIQQDKLKELEKQGYEVIELHMDASLESGVGTGRGVILPMPGTDAINPVEADFARTAGAFSRTHRGGLAGTNRGISLIELGNMSPELQQKVLRGNGLTKQELDRLTKPLEDSLIRGMGLQERASLGGPQSREVASLQRTPDYAEGQTTILYQKEVVLVG